jgi:hypothetical protein
MHDIPYGLTPAGLLAREQLHDKNSDFATAINIFSTAFSIIFFTKKADLCLLSG